MPDLSAPRQWHASSQNPFHRRERERFRETEQPLLPTSRSRSKAGWDASLLFLTLALVTSGSMGWLALKIFCASCWGLRQERGESGPRPPQLWAAHPGPAVAPPPAAAHRLSCFQRWKKSWAAISVGWKNLLMVTGSFRVRDWGAPPYLARKEEDSIRSRPSPRSPARLADPTDSPEAHRQERRCQEVAQTLDIEHLLHLRPAVHLRGHALGLHGQLCAPSLRKPETGGGSSGALLRTSKGPGVSSQVQPTRPSSRVLPMLNHWPSTMDSATSMTAHCHIVLRQETP